MQYKIQLTILSAAILLLAGCNSGQSPISNPNLENSHAAQSEILALGSQNISSQQYAAELKQINSPDAQALASYYSKINPVKIIQKQQFIYDCIPFEQQQAIIDLPATQKEVAIKNANEILTSMENRLSSSENQKLYANSFTSGDNCPFGLISQMRPNSDLPKMRNPRQNSLNKNNSIITDPSPSDPTKYGYKILTFPNNLTYYSVPLMATQPASGTTGPNVFFASNDINAITQPGNRFIDHQMWLMNNTQSIEFGWTSYGGTPPALFAYGNTSQPISAIPGNVPFIAAPGTPFPANQGLNYHQTLSLYYLIADKRPGDSYCGGDPSGCYALEVAETNQGSKPTGYWLVGWYSKSYFNTATMTTLELGMELHYGPDSSPPPTNAYGAIYNAGINLTRSDEQDFSLQNFQNFTYPAGTPLNGVYATWSPGLLPVGVMTFSGSWQPKQ